MYKLALLSIVFLCAFTSPTYSPDSNIDELLKEFVEDRDCLKISLSGNLLKFKNKDKIESEIESFQLYVFSDDDPLQKEDMKSLSKMVKSSNLEMLNMVRSDGNKIEIYVKDNDDVIEELFMTILGDDNSVILHANGKIRYEDVKHIDTDFDF